MELEVLRFSSQKESTLGLLFDVSLNKRKFLCFTLEDEYRTKKIYGQTRIPTGTYEVKLKKEGGFHNRYKIKFPDFHKGMLEITNVKGFDYILIHIGNNDDDTAGCLLVGDSLRQNITDKGFVGSSTIAYKRVYSIIANLLDLGGKVVIKYIDFDTKSNLHSG